LPPLPNTPNLNSFSLYTPNLRPSLKLSNKKLKYLTLDKDAVPRLLISSSSTSVLLFITAFTGFIIQYNIDSNEYYKTLLGVIPTDIAYCIIDIKDKIIDPEVVWNNIIFDIRLALNIMANPLFFELAYYRFQALVDETLSKIIQRFKMTKLVSFKNLNIISTKMDMCILYTSFPEYFK
jgi:hypothetical protein